MMDKEFAALEALYKEYKSKKWETDKGHAVRFVGFMRNDFYPLIVVETAADGSEKCGAMTKDFRGSPQEKFPYIREVTPYNWPIDTKILVWNEGDDYKSNEYFAGVSGVSGSPLSWTDGATSWSADGFSTAWKYAELFKEETINEK